MVSILIKIRVLSIKECSLNELYFTLVSYTLHLDAAKEHMVVHCILMQRFCNSKTHIGQSAEKKRLQMSA